MDIVCEYLVYFRDKEVHREVFVLNEDTNDLNFSFTHIIFSNIAIINNSNPLILSKIQIYFNRIVKFLRKYYYSNKQIVISEFKQQIREFKITKYTDSYNTQLKNLISLSKRLFNESYISNVTIISLNIFTTDEIQVNMILRVGKNISDDIYYPINIIIKETCFEYYINKGFCNIICEMKNIESVEKLMSNLNKDIRKLINKCV